MSSSSSITKTVAFNINLNFKNLTLLKVEAFVFCAVPLLEERDLRAKWFEPIFALYKAIKTSPC